MAAEQSLLEGRTAARSPIGFLLGKKNSGIRVTRYLQVVDSFQRGNVMVTSYLVPGHTDGSAAYLAGEHSTWETALILVKTEGCYRQRDS